MKRLAPLCFLIVVGCAKQLVASGPAEFSMAWSESKTGFAATDAAWTRHGELHRDMQQALVVDATLRSPAWRSSWVNTVAVRRNFNDAQRSTLVAEQKAASEQRLEFALVVTTWDRRENDLQRGDLATWRVVLEDGTGQVFAPDKITLDRRPEHVLRADYPNLRDFASVYIASFPGKQTLLDPNNRSLALRIEGARGAVKLSWTNAAQAKSASQP